MQFDVRPIYGWGWSGLGREWNYVPGPFTMDAVVRDTDGFKTALGRFDDTDNPLGSLWIVLSPIPNPANSWDWSVVKASPNEPSIPDDFVTLLNSALPITGYAKVHPISD